MYACARQNASPTWVGGVKCVSSAPSIAVFVRIPVIPCCAFRAPVVLLCGKKLPPPNPSTHSQLNFMVSTATTLNMGRLHTLFTSNFSHRLVCARSKDCDTPWRLFARAVCSRGKPNCSCVVCCDGSGVFFLSIVQNETYLSLSLSRSFNIFLVYNNDRLCAPKSCSNWTGD